MVTGFKEPFSGILSGKSAQRLITVFAGLSTDDFSESSIIALETDFKGLLVEAVPGADVDRQKEA